MVDMRLADPLAGDLDMEMFDCGMELCHPVPELLRLQGFALHLQDVNDMAHD